MEVDKMLSENGLLYPENQREYCELCLDRLMDGLCPCKSYNDLPLEEKFDLEDPLGEE